MWKLHQWLILGREVFPESLSKFPDVQRASRHTPVALSANSESIPRNLSLWKSKETFLFFSLGYKLELELELGLKLEWLEGVSKSLGRCVFCTVLIRGAKHPHNYNAKYTSLPRAFDNPSSHSNFHPNSNSNLNSKLKDKKVKKRLFLFHRHRFLGIDCEFAEFLSRWANLMLQSNHGIQ